MAARPPGGGVVPQALRRHGRPLGTVVRRGTTVPGAVVIANGATQERSGAGAEWRRSGVAQERSGAGAEWRRSGVAVYPPYGYCWRTVTDRGADCLAPRLKSAGGRRSAPSLARWVRHRCTNRPLVCLQFANSIRTGGKPPLRSRLHPVAMTAGPEEASVSRPFRPFHGPSLPMTPYPRGDEEPVAAQASHLWGD